jgi:hypothetical protein
VEDLASLRPAQNAGRVVHFPVHTGLADSLYSAQHGPVQLARRAARAAHDIFVANRSAVSAGFAGVDDETGGNRWLRTGLVEIGRLSVAIPIWVSIPRGGFSYGYAEF